MKGRRGGPSSNYNVRCNLLPVTQSEGASPSPNFRNSRPLHKTAMAYELHRAAAKGLTEAVGELLGRNADIDAVDATGATPLHLAATAGHEPVARLLLDSGASFGKR